MRSRFFLFSVVALLIFAGCNFDYNNYPYQGETQPVIESTTPSAETPAASDSVPVPTVEAPVIDETAVSEPAAVESPVATESTAATEPVAEEAVEPETTTVVTSAPQTVTFNVSASQFSFSPNVLTVNKGDTVVINFTPTDVPHGFSLPDFNVSLSGEPGETATATFVADKAGTFTFACSVMCGSGHADMKGTFIVNE